MIGADDVLLALLIVSILFGIGLAFVSMAAAGRTLADLEHQAERGVTGSPRIQAWVNLRTSANRAAFGVVFVVINVLLLAGAPEIWRMWVNRILWTALLASFLLISVQDWVAEREQVRISLRAIMATKGTQDALANEAIARRASDAAADRESYRQIANEAVANLEAAARLARETRGEPPLPALAAVIPEHQSLTTAQQRDVADAATIRARLVAATLGLGLPPREPSEEAGRDMRRDVAP